MTKELGIAKLVLEESQGLDDIKPVDYMLAQTACLYQIAVSLDQISESLNKATFKLECIDRDLKGISGRMH